MNCPVCKTTKLSPKELEPGLYASNCPQCGGDWIAGVEYWRWLEEHGLNLPEREADTSGLQAGDTKDPLDCPECKWRMTKYMVGKGHDFAVDHCSGCRGLWLDRNEWETLKARNLHDDIHGMLTDFWQSQARRDVAGRRAEQRYIEKFGAEDYAEIRRIRSWLRTHRNKEELMTYLTAQDPLTP